MTNHEIFEMLRQVDDNITGATIETAITLHDGATYYYVSLNLEDDNTMDIPVIHYEGEDWVFAPWDWQCCFAGDISDVETVRWRAGDQEAIMMDGLPRVFAL